MTRADKAAEVLCALHEWNVGDRVLCRVLQSWAVGTIGRCMVSYHDGEPERTWVRVDVDDGGTSDYWIDVDDDAHMLRLL